MRYLGNKTKLLDFIKNVITKHDMKGSSFADLFAGTCSVGDYFKDSYKIIANDYMYFSKVISEAKLKNACIPRFKNFVDKYSMSPFEWLNNRIYYPQENYFIYKNYTPIGNRMFFTESNAIKIDGIRIEIEEFYKSNLLDINEYVFLLASILESVLKVSNTSGTYQAFFKFWESRATKKFMLSPLEMNSVENIMENEIFNVDTNDLIRKISGDIAYIDPPYTTTQYTNSYHILETIAKYDYPEIFGKTGRRVKRELSGYSNKQKALIEFEDLFRQLDFKHIMVSYSNQSIVPIHDLIELAKLFAVNGKVYIEENEYREYATNNSSYKGKGKQLKEIILYFQKDNTINKSPLNYSGSKDGVLKQIYKELPKHVGSFVDAMGGAFNVGANVYAIEKVYYNEYNPYIHDIIFMLLNKKSEDIINNIQNIIKEFGLNKKDKNAYLKLRDYYNNSNNPLILFVLQIYAFQNMIRFNSAQKMNTPVGNNEFSEGIRDRIANFVIKSPKYEVMQGKFEELNIDNFPKNTVFYFDPPYFITNAEYNDGKRGLEGWNSDKESALLNFLFELDLKGYKFMLSNVLFHKGKEHHLLKEWISAHGYNVVEIGKTGIKYPRLEVLVTNYNS